MAFKLPKNIQQLADQHGISINQEPTAGDRIQHDYVQRKKDKADKKLEKAKKAESQGKWRKALRKRKKAKKKSDQAKKMENRWDYNSNL